MPDIDLNDVILDTSVAGEPFQVVRRPYVLTTDGKVVITPDVLPHAGTPGIYGGITPVGENSLLREESLQTSRNAIQVITTFRLRCAFKDPTTGQNYQPDLVLWQGDYFVVRIVNDWTQYGAGFMEAECTLFDWNDTEPV